MADDGPEAEAGAEPAPSRPETGAQRLKRLKREVVEAERTRIMAVLDTMPAVVDGAELSPEQAARHLIALLTGFHRREDKPVWWALFDRQDREDAELVDDEDCFGDLRTDKTEGNDGWIGTERQSYKFRFRVPAQETKLTVGAEVYLGATAGQPERAGTIRPGR